MAKKVENCEICGKKFGFITARHEYNSKEICYDCLLGEEQKALKQKALKRKQRNQAISKVCLTTGDIKTPYRILDTIITVKAHQAGYFDSANPSTAFDGIKNELRTIAYDMEADAVIYCQFEYRVGAEQGMLSGYLGGKQFVEIFAYGTAVKLQKDKPPPVKGNEIN